jgi:hypothetical protein
METKLNLKKVLVTPTVAKELLLKNNSNRRVSKQTVNSYAHDMRENRWKENTAEFIKVAEDGEILDGQHRLLAVIESNSSIYFDIAYGVNKSVFDVLDTGKIRSSSDVFSTEKIENYTVITAIVKSYLALSKNHKADLNSSSKSNKLTNTIILEEYKKRPEFWQEVATFSHKSYKNFAHILPTSFIGTLYSYFYDISPETSRHFINQLCTGESITNSSITVLRQSLLKDKVSQRKMQPQDKLAIIVKTWNAFRTGRNYRIMKYDRNFENMPKPI